MFRLKRTSWYLVYVQKREDISFNLVTGSENSLNLHIVIKREDSAAYTHSENGI